MGAVACWCPRSLPNLRGGYALLLETGTGFRFLSAFSWQEESPKQKEQEIYCSIKETCFGRDILRVVAHTFPPPSHKPGAYFFFSSALPEMRYSRFLPVAGQVRFCRNPDSIPSPIDRGPRRPSLPRQGTPELRGLRKFPILRGWRWVRLAFPRDLESRTGRPERRRPGVLLSGPGSFV